MRKQHQQFAGGEGSREHDAFDSDSDHDRDHNVDEDQGEGDAPRQEEGDQVEDLGVRPCADHDADHDAPDPASHAHEDASVHDTPAAQGC